MTDDQRLQVVLTKDAPARNEAGELLAGPWRARAVMDEHEFEVRGAMTRWGAKHALRRLIKKALRKPIVEEIHV